MCLEMSSPTTPVDATIRAGRALGKYVQRSRRKMEKYLIKNAKIEKSDLTLGAHRNSV